MDVRTSSKLKGFMVGVGVGFDYFVVSIKKGVIVDAEK